MRRVLIWLSAAMTLLLSGCAKSASLGVIGGADGPTAVFVSTGDGFWQTAVLFCAAAAGILTAAVVPVRKRRRRRRNGDQ